MLLKSAIDKCDQNTIEIHLCTQSSNKTLSLKTQHAYFIEKGLQLIVMPGATMKSQQSALFVIKCVP